MPLNVNLRHLDAHNLRLQGQLPVEELDLETRDEMIQINQPLDYDFEAQQVEDGLLLQGRLSVVMGCQCVRCLKAFTRPLLIGHWTRLVPLQGEEAAPVVSDCVDLTPYLREDILLEFPQHPLCEPECRGLPKASMGTSNSTGSTAHPKDASPAWDELNKLKF